jgi:hypothetical protein
MTQMLHSFGTSGVFNQLINTDAVVSEANLFGEFTLVIGLTRCRPFSILPDYICDQSEAMATPFYSTDLRRSRGRISRSAIDGGSICCNLA